MIPEVTSSDTVSFIDALAARENNSDRSYDFGKSYEAVSQEHNAAQSKKQNIANPGVEQDPETQVENGSTADPVKVNKAAKDIVNKVKKLASGEKIDESNDEIDVDDDELNAIYFLLLNVIETRLDEHVDKVTGDIAHINLNVEGAVEKILAHAELIDATKDLALKIQSVTQDLLGSQIDIPDLDIEIDPIQLQAINTDIDNLVHEYQQAFNPGLNLEFDTGAANDTITVGQKLRGLVDLVKPEEIKVVEIKNEQVSLDGKRPVNPLELQVQYKPEHLDGKALPEQAPKVIYELPVAKAGDIKAGDEVVIKADLPELADRLNLGEVVRVQAKGASETKIDLNSIKEEIGFERETLAPVRPRLIMHESTKHFEGVDDVEMVDAEIDVQVEDLMADSSSSDSSGGEALLASHQEIQAATVIKMPAKVDVVKPIDISSYLQEQVSELPKNSRQEIKLQLNPETLGKIDLTVSKNENNEISIRMMFHDAKTLTHLKTDLKDSLVELKEALKLKNLDLSRFEVGQSRSSSTAYDSQQQQSESYNEARDEQKERLLNTTPEWLGMANQTSYEEVAADI